MIAIRCGICGKKYMTDGKANCPECWNSKRLAEREPTGAECWEAHTKGNRYPPGYHSANYIGPRLMRWIMRCINAKK
jgi:hypothetical protein